MWVLLCDPKEECPNADKVNPQTRDYLVLNMAAALVYNLEDNAKNLQQPVIHLIAIILSKHIH